MTNNLLESLNIQTKDGQAFDVPVEGSLGLLALGDIGLWIWREKQKQVKASFAKKSEPKSNTLLNQKDK